MSVRSPIPDTHADEALLFVVVSQDALHPMMSADEILDIILIPLSPIFATEQDEHQGYPFYGLSVHGMEYI